MTKAQRRLSWTRATKKYRLTEAGREANRRAAATYRATRHGKAKIAVWKDSPRGRASMSASSLRANKRQRLLYPEKTSARQAAQNAIRDGRLQRLPCEVCGNPKAQAHHDDYSEPLTVRFLCRKHHDEHHKGKP